MTARLPDAKFFQFADDHSTVLVMVRYSRQGGNKDYFLVNGVSELAALVVKLPVSASVSIAYPGDIEWADHVYTPDANGDCKPGSY